MTTVPANVLATVYNSKPEDWHQHPNGGGWAHKAAPTAYVEVATCA